MKKIIMSLFSIAFLVLTTTAASPFLKNNPGQTKEASTNKIAYIVHVTAPNALVLCHSYFVYITDVSGNLVATPQPYQDGVEDYTFYEEGPVYGGRVAKLDDLDILKHHFCGQKVYTAPDAIINKFLNSTSYMFYLYPVIIPGDD